MKIHTYLEVYYMSREDDYYYWNRKANESEGDYYNYKRKAEEQKENYDRLKSNIEKLE